MKKFTAFAFALVVAIVAVLSFLSTPTPAQVLVGDYTIARGTVTLDGSNPTPASTGLVSIVACNVNDRRTTAPADEVNMLTVGYSGATLNVYAWTNTGGTDPTQAASSDADDVIDWICIGTK